jgi:protein gp37
MATSRIEWTDSSWNPITGCTKISPGCQNCYAERMAKRLQAMKNPNYKNGFNLTLHENTLNYPLIWRTPRLIFVNSMSDLFHEEVPIYFIKKTFDIMRQAHWHIFQILTKRSNRLLELNNQIDWPNNVWMGVSVETKEYTFRIEDLKSTNAILKFISFEPLLGPIKELDLFNIDWVIVGGESGPRSRLMEKSWVLQIKDFCKTQNTPFFFKQWGGTNKKKTGRLLDGSTWNEMPMVKTAVAT